MDSIEIINKASERSLTDLWVQVAGGIASIGTVLTFIYLIIIQRSRDNTQQFENSLFNLLSLHNQIISNLNYKDSQEIVTGRAVFTAAKVVSSGMMEMSHINKVDNKSYTVVNISQSREALTNEYYKSYYIEFESNLNHYFRNLYHIFLYIDTSSLIPDWNPFRKNKRKYNYARIVRAQLSQDELFAIMLNCMIQGHGYPEFLKLVNKYAILKNFRNKDVKCRPFYELFCDMLKDVNPNTVDGGVVIEYL